MSKEDAEEFDKLQQEISYNDRLQYCYKIKLNSLYGALLNQHFRFYDYRMGSSTTGSGRATLRHMCAIVNQCLTGEYDLHGDAIVYGDSVTGESLIRTETYQAPIKELFLHVDDTIGSKEYYRPQNVKTLTFDRNNNKHCYKPIKYIVRHKVNKKMYRVHTLNGLHVDVTEDHSLIVIDQEGNLTEMKPSDLHDAHYLIIWSHEKQTHCPSIFQLEEIEYDDYVYDIEVEDTHMFFANDILVHNTDSSYFKTFGKDTNEALLIADAIEIEVNKTFKKFAQQAFLCNSEHDKYIKAAREVVASRGIFITPKRYILHLINLDGQPCDKLKVMGVDTKKTILPPFIQDKLNGYIERYLKGEDWDSIASDIVEYKNWLKTEADITLLGYPKGVNKVEFYNEKLKIEGEDANLPGHVRAGILYNRKLLEYNDKESIPVNSSMKIKVFYLKQPIGKFKSIALPVDLEQTPEWFNNMEIDRDKQIERLIDNPLRNILKAVGKEPPTAQMLFVDSLLDF